MKQSRTVYIDILRVVACFLVIFNHTNARGFSHYISDDLGSFFWWRNLWFSTVCKSAVPIFFMISGSLLLRKEETIIQTYKRIPKILIDLLIFSIAYFWTDSFYAGSKFSLKDTLNVMLSSEYWHLWYLYSYATLIITMPFLRKMVNGLDAGTMFYMFIVAFITMGIVPIVELFFTQGINGNLKPSWVVSYIFIYPVVGYELDCKLDIKDITRKHLCILWMANLLCFAVGEISEFYYLTGNPGNSTEIFLNNFCLVNSVSVYLTIKYFMKNIRVGQKIYTFITETGKCTFGIYLLHIWFLWKIPFFYDKWMLIEQGGIFGNYAGVFISCLCVFILAGFTTYVMRKIPIIRKLF